MQQSLRNHKGQIIRLVFRDQSLCFLQYDSATGSFSVTQTGKDYIAQPAKKGINDVLKEAMLSYSPAVRVLRLLDQHKHLTKFEIGSELGFVGEDGFTFYPQDAFVSALATATRSDARKMFERLGGFCG